MNFLGFAVLGMALAFCGIGDKLKSMSGSTGNSSTGSSNSTGKADSTNVEKADMTSIQKSIADGASEVKWDDQSISWKLPSSFPKMQVAKESFNYGSPGSGFLIASISKMSADFPVDSSLDAYYTSALEKVKQGDYTTARWLEIDGIKGVEFVEAPPEEKDGIRRYQWIAYRNYQGQSQMLNIMLSTNGANFEKHKDTFAAVMYSMKIAKG
jgi:hypothetical protein